MTDTSQAFSLFLDSQKMQAIFQDVLPDCLSGGWELTECQIQHPRYKTYLNPDSRGKSFLAAAFHLKGINQPTQKPQEGIVYVKAYLGELSQAEHEKARTTFQDNPQHGPLLIEKYGMVTWFFPHDPTLPALPKIMDTGWMRGYFADNLLAGDADVACGIKDISVQIINYRPEIRCTYRYDLETNSRAKRVLYGKTFADGKGAEIHQRLALLQNEIEKQTESFTLPKPVAYDGALNTLWMGGLQGRPLLEVINKTNADELIIQVARNLAGFHQSRLAGLETINEDSLLAEIEKKSIKLQSAFPTLAARMEAVIAQLAQQLKHLPYIPGSVIHGDFHIQQLMQLPDQRIALFDFDELALANPLVDVANFSADLYTLFFGKDCTQAMIHKLFKAYQSFSSYALTDAHFDWHLRVQLLTRAYRAYIQQKKDNVTIVEQFLLLAEQGYMNKSVGMNNDV